MGRERGAPPPDEPVIVVGLGRFGVSVATSLVRLGHEVLAIDDDPELVQRWASELTHVVQADATDEEALRQIGAEQFTRAVVGIGSNLEASVLTVLNLKEMGIDEIWAKATNAKHGDILHRIGAKHVVYPETAMGERIAHTVTGQMTDYIEFDDGFAIARTRAPRIDRARTLTELAWRSKYEVTIVGVKHPGQDFTYAQADTKIESRDELIVSGPTKKVEKFCAVNEE